METAPLVAGAITLGTPEAPLLLERLSKSESLCAASSDFSYCVEIVSRTPPLKSPKLRLLSIVVSSEKVVLMMPTSRTPVRMEMSPKAVMAENGVKKAPTNWNMLGMKGGKNGPTAAKFCPNVRR